LISLQNIEEVSSPSGPQRRQSTVFDHYLSVEVQSSPGFAGEGIEHESIGPFFYCFEERLERFYLSRVEGKVDGEAALAFFCQGG
jgi:hypothetical protein